MPFEVFPYTNFHELNLDWIIDAMKSLSDKTELIDDAVSEAQGYAEQAEAAVEALNASYVTPEMYGAVGDGVTDDTVAVQEALTHDLVLMHGNYYITDTLVIDHAIKIFQKGEIIYDGLDSAIRLQEINNNCDLYLDTIRSSQGNGVEFYASNYSNDNRRRVQYVNLYFNLISAYDKCILFNLDVTTGLSANDVGWLNEIHIFNGRLSAGNYGVYADAKGYQKLNNIKFYNVGFEGITTGIYMANNCLRWGFVNCRYAESYTTLFETVGTNTFVFIGTQEIDDSANSFSSDTDAWLVAPRPSTGGYSATLIRHVANGSVTLLYRDDLAKVNRLHNNTTGTYSSADPPNIVDVVDFPGNGWYIALAVTNTSVSTDILGVYLIYYTGGNITQSITIHQGTHAQTPVVAADGTITKLNSTSTTSMYVFTIRI